MFSGIVEAVSAIKQKEVQSGGIQFAIVTPAHFADLEIGASVAVNGVCLTITALLDDTFQVMVVPETMRVTNLAELTSNSPVNLERALKCDDRFGGHCVQGHVDATGEILEITTDGHAALIAKIGVPAQLTKYIVNKGYIAIDGMSITVIDTAAEWFMVTFIPHTQQVTVVNQYRIGKTVNIEVDIFGKYIEKLLERSAYAVLR